jgi:hypothetical protein
LLNIKMRDLRSRRQVAVAAVAAVPVSAYFRT